MEGKTFIYCILAVVVMIMCSGMIQADVVHRKDDVKSKGNGKYETPVVGIDLGTTYSVVAIYRNSKVEIIPNDQGNRITPSVVSFEESGEKIIGDAAKNNAPLNPSNTLYDVKRFIGRRFNEVQKKDAKLVSYKLKNKEGKTFIKYERRSEDGKMKTEEVSPEEISAMVLARLKTYAETYLGEPVKYAVVTVPAYFNDAQRQATADAGKIAGLEVLRILNEPTAASMAYGLYEKKEKNILVYDLGGGTFDVSLLTIDNGVFEVIATSGDTHLGGEDFDVRIVEYLAKKFNKKNNKDVMKNKRSFQKLKREAERAKRILSTETETEIEIDNLLDGISFNEKLSRAQFENLNKDLFSKTLQPVKQVLKDANIGKDEIDEVVMVGGSTRIPKIQQLVSKLFNNKKLNTDIDPDEAVGYGAAVQAAVLSGTMSSSQEIVLIDVTPLSLGIETQGGVMAVIIPRNTPVPAERSDTFTTTGDYQERLVIPVYEGERRMTAHNRLLGELELTDIPPAPRGVPQIKVTFQLDQNGILKIIALDEGTKNKKELTIRKGSLSKEDIEKMTKDAEKNEAEDRKFLERIEIKQKLEQYIDEVKTQMANKNIAARLSSQNKNAVIAQLKKTIRWMKSNRAQSAPLSKYKKQLKQLRKTVNPIISSIYGQQKLSDDDIFASDDDDDDEEEEEDTSDDINVEDSNDDSAPITEDEEDKQETTTNEQPKQEETKQEQPKQEETKKEETKKEETKQEETKKEEL